MSDTTFSPFITLSSTSFAPIVIYNGMSLAVEKTRECQCDTPLAMTKPMAVSNKGRMYVCTSWCPFCGTKRRVECSMYHFPKTAPNDVWELDADKIYMFVNEVNRREYLPIEASDADLAWTYPQSYSDGTFTVNIFNMAIGRGLTVRAPKGYILKDTYMSQFDKQVIQEFDQLGSLGLIYPKEPAHANA